MHNVYACIYTRTFVFMDKNVNLKIPIAFVLFIIDDNLNDTFLTTKAPCCAILCVIT